MLTDCCRINGNKIGDTFLSAKSWANLLVLSDKSKHLQIDKTLSGKVIFFITGEFIYLKTVIFMKTSNHANIINLRCLVCNETPATWGI